LRTAREVRGRANSQFTSLQERRVSEEMSDKVRRCEIQGGLRKQELLHGAERRRGGNWRTERETS
jgi:hypothetical protein